jgi:PTH1 family peptidyl-tRNA hydrolase
MSIAVIVGLGNPGPEYSGTRHNLGFIVVDAFAQAIGASWGYERRFKADIAKASVEGHAVYLLKPLSYMNLSGESVNAFMQYYNFPLSSLCVLHDETAFPIGQGRLTLTQGSGGHNGVQSLIQHLGKGFLRYRLGIGEKPHPAMDLTEHVLGPFSAQEKAALVDAYITFLNGLQLLVTQGPAKAMNIVNRT